MRLTQPPYSPHLDFVVTKPFKLDGVAYEYGAAFPTSLVSESKLRKLFDARMIAPKGFGEAPPAYLHNGKGLSQKLAAQTDDDDSDAEAVVAQPSQTPASAPKRPRRSTKRAA